MPFSIFFSVLLQTEILLTVTSDFLKLIIFLRSFSYMLTVVYHIGVSIHHQENEDTFMGSNPIIFTFALRVDLIALLSKLPYLFGYNVGFPPL